MLAASARVGRLAVARQHEKFDALGVVFILHLAVNRLGCLTVSR